MEELNKSLLEEIEILKKALDDTNAELKKRPTNDVTRETDAEKGNTRKLDIEVPRSSSDSQYDKEVTYNFLIFLLSILTIIIFCSLLNMRFRF